SVFEHVQVLKSCGSPLGEQMLNGLSPSALAEEISELYSSYSNEFRLDESQVKDICLSVSTKQYSLSPLKFELVQDSHTLPFTFHKLCDPSSGKDVCFRLHLTNADDDLVLFGLASLLNSTLNESILLKNPYKLSINNGMDYSSSFLENWNRVKQLVSLYF